MASFSAAVPLLSERQNGDVVGIALGFRLPARRPPRRTTEDRAASSRRAEAIEERHDAIDEVTETVHLEVPAVVAGLTDRSAAGVCRGRARAELDPSETR
jgi:hypothetical protein